MLLAGSLAMLLAAPACNPTTIDPVPDPNNPGIDTVLTNASPAQISALGVGLEAILRLGHTNNAPNNQILGVLGREILILASNEPRWFTEVLGTRGSIDNSSFYGLGSYNAFARVIRSAKVFRASAQNAAVLTAEEKQAVYGFCDTYEALGKLQLLNLMGANGIRVVVDDIFKPGPFVSQTDALANIRQLLDQGRTELNAAGTASFPFPLSGGYAGFNSPATFVKANRALAARVALYQNDNAGALVALTTSFYDPAGSLQLGPKITFNPTSAGDQGNSYFQPLNSGPSTYVTIPDNFTTEAETGDLRLSKAVLRTAAPRTLGGITGRYDSNVFSTQTTSLGIIRNEELILISAEAKAKTNDFAGALADINTIRVRAGGLAALTTASFTGVNDYIDEILKQRRYSLLYEGHRLVDLRRLDRLKTLPTVAPNQTLAFSTSTYKIFAQLRKPAAEELWDIANPQ